MTKKINKKDRSSNQNKRKGSPAKGKNTAKKNEQSSAEKSQRRKSTDTDGENQIKKVC